MSRHYLRPRVKSELRPASMLLDSTYVHEERAAPTHAVHMPCAPAATPQHAFDTVVTWPRLSLSAPSFHSPSFHSSPRSARRSARRSAQRDLSCLRAERLLLGEADRFDRRAVLGGRYWRGRGTCAISLGGNVCEGAERSSITPSRASRFARTCGEGWGAVVSACMRGGGTPSRASQFARTVSMVDWQSVVIRGHHQWSSVVIRGPRTVSIIDCERSSDRSPDLDRSPSASSLRRDERAVRAPFAPFLNSSTSSCLLRRSVRTADLCCSILLSPSRIICRMASRSMAIKSAIKGHQAQSRAPSSAIKRHQGPSSAIKRNQAQSPGARRRGSRTSPP